MAIDDLLDEHEQSERVKKWLRENGLALLVGIAIAIAALFGFKYWQAQRALSAQKPGADYVQASQALEAGETAKASAALAGLQGNPYATLLALEIAAKQVQAGDNAAAIATLAAVKESDPQLQLIVNQRHARLLMDAQQYDAAKAVLANADDATSQSLQGDIAMATEQREQARQAYLNAWQQLELGSPQRLMLELKLSELGGVPSTDEGTNEG